MAKPSGGMAYADDVLIFAETLGHRIRRIDADGIITTIAGTGAPGYSGDGGLATEAEINGPVDVEAAPDGSIYFSDTENSCVRRLTPTPTQGGLEASYLISTVAGVCDPNPRNRGFAGDGGDPRTARLAWPIGIALDGDLLYVADSYNHRVRLVSLMDPE